MLSSWIKRSTALAIVLMMVPAAVFAQTSRVAGLGLQGDFIKDYSNIYAYPSELSNVGNLIWGELGTTGFSTSSPSDRGVGAVLGNLWDGRYGTWGVSLHEMHPGLGQGDASSGPNPGSLGFDPNSNGNSAFDLMWGWRAGNSNIGLNVHRAFYQHEESMTGVATNLEFDVPAGGDPNLNRNVWGIGGGIDFEMNPNTSVELSAAWQNRSFEASTPGAGADNDLAEEDSPTTYMLSGRAFWQWQPNVVVVPLVKWYSFDLSRRTVPSGGAAATTTNELRGWQVGVAGNWTLGTDDLFVLGVTFAGNKVEQQEDLFGLAAAANARPGALGGLSDTLDVTETLAPQIFAALETHVNDWLTLRLGATQAAYSKLKVEDASSSGTQEITSSPFEMSLGAGVKIGTLQFDTVLNSNFPQTLGAFFSQSSDYVSFGKVTATYAF